MNMEYCWNDTDGGNRRTRRETCPGAILSTTNPMWTGLGMRECLMKDSDNPVTTGHYRPLLFGDGMLQSVGR